MLYTLCLLMVLSCSGKADCDNVPSEQLHFPYLAAYHLHELQEQYPEVKIPLVEVLAVGAIESKWLHVGQLSSAGAYGYMQITPIAAKEVNRTYALQLNPAKEADNIRLGILYLNSLYLKYGNIYHTLMAYNWGPGNLDAHLRKGSGWMPDETREYIRRYKNYNRQCHR